MRCAVVGSYSPGVEVIPSAPQLRPGTMSDAQRLRRIKEALLIAASLCTTNERPMYSSVRRSLTMCVRSLESSGAKPPPLDKPLPWEG